MVPKNARGLVPSLERFTLLESSSRADSRCEDQRKNTEHVSVNFSFGVRRASDVHRRGAARHLNAPGQGSSARASRKILSCSSWPAACCGKTSAPWPRGSDDESISLRSASRPRCQSISSSGRDAESPSASAPPLREPMGAKTWSYCNSGLHASLRFPPLSLGGERGCPHETPPSRAITSVLAAARSVLRKL